MLQQEESSQPSLLLPLLPQYIDDAEQSYLHTCLLSSHLRQTFLYVFIELRLMVSRLTELQHSSVLTGPVPLLSLEADRGLKLLQCGLLVLARAGPASTRPSWNQLVMTEDGGEERGEDTKL